MVHQVRAVTFSDGGKELREDASPASKPHRVSLDRVVKVGSSIVEDHAKCCEP